jgi:general secretion pathway protein M
MRQWYGSLVARERRMVWLIAVCLMVLLALLVWRPVLQQRAQLGERIQRQQASLVEMQLAAREVQRLQASRSPVSQGPRSDGRSLLALADESARTRGLGEALRRVEPQGDNRVRMLIEDAQFAAVSGWLETLQYRLGVEVEDISIERRSLPGLVSVRLTLLDRRPGVEGAGS